MSKATCSNCSAEIPGSVMLCSECGHPFSQPPASRDFFGRMLRFIEELLP